MSTGERPTGPENAGREREMAARLLAQVRDVAAELRPHLADAPVTLDSALDKDLGLDSLGRVEVMVRLERAFGVSLPEAAFADAETPRDLLRAIQGAGGAGAPGPAAVMEKAAPAEAAVGEATVPFAAKTLTEVLDWHADAHGGRPHIRLYDDEGKGEAITFRDLADGARRVAAGLQQGGFEPGQAAVIMLPTGHDYFLSFFGVLYAGGVPVPIYPPGRPSQIEEHLLRHARIVDNCRATILITVEEAKRFGGMLARQAESLKSVATADELMARAGAFTPPALKAGDIAFIQYTSGSTGDPKGVVLTHANLLANIRAMGAALEADSKDVFVSWLPLYHDMGLIGAWLGNLHYASLLVIMPPLSFLSRPIRWLRAIHRARATISGGPNFAYELCLSRLADKDLDGLDLSSWRIAFNGAEAVNPATLERFVERFGPSGFRAEAMFPVFGLAECSVGLAFPPLGRRPVIDRIRREVFMETGRAEETGADDAAALRFVNCGRPLPGHQIRVVDGAGRELPERREGRLQFQGPSATSGYYRNPEETAKLFDGEWLNAGDLAYIAGGDVHITGRTKDVIIRAGRNIYPAELEDAVGRLEGVQKGNVAVFGVGDPGSGTERLVVLAETRKREPADRDRIRARINELALDLIGAPPDDVVLAPPRTVLKTSSGKVRRAACRDIYEKGLVGKPPSAVWWQVARLSLAAVGPRLRQGARGLSSLAVGAWGWAVVAAIGPVLWAGTFVVRSLEARWAFFGAGVRLAARLLGVPIAVEGLENLPPADAPAVFVSNHASYLDGFMLCAALPRPVRFVAKTELKGSLLTRVPLDYLEAEYVERFDRRRGVEDATRVAAGVNEGRSPLFFAEGTFSRMPGLLPFHMGAFVAAVESGAPVVPVTIRGTRSVLRDKSWLLRPGPVTVRIGEPIRPPAGGDPWDRAVTLRDQVRAEILRHTGEPDLGRERVDLAPPSAG